MPNAATASSHRYSTPSYRSTAASFFNFVNSVCRHPTSRTKPCSNVQATKEDNPAFCNSSGCHPIDPRELPVRPAVPGGGALPAASDMAPTMFTRHKDVMFYVPNLIGYARIGLTLGALACARQYPLLCVATYFLAFVCDELDGRAARAFNQTSIFGAVLDMVTDRVATTGLLALLCTTYPDFHIVFIALIALDIFSHWFQMYQTLLAGSTTHKDVNSRSWLVRLYYSNRIFMGFCCVCCEVLYLALFLLHLPLYQTFGLLDVQLPAPLLHALQSGPLHALVDEWQGLPIVGLVALAAVPGVVVKQLCNWVQLKAAVQGLVEHDVKRMA